MGDLSVSADKPVLYTKEYTGVTEGTKASGTEIADAMSRGGDVTETSNNPPEPIYDAEDAAGQFKTTALRNKRNRREAREYADAAFDKIGDMVADYNSEHPDKLIVVDFSKFPKLESLVEEAGNGEQLLATWKTRVDTWVGNRERDIRNGKTAMLAEKVNEQEQRFNMIMDALGKIYAAEVLGNQQVIDIVAEASKNTNYKMDEIKKRIDGVSRQIGNVSGQIKEVAENQNTMIAKLDIIRENTTKIMDKVDRATRKSMSRDLQILNNVKKIYNTLDDAKKEEAEKAALRLEIFVALHNDDNKAMNAVRAVMREDNMRYDKSGTGIIEKGANLDVVNNMTLAQLQRVRGRMIEPAADPLVHK